MICLLLLFVHISYSLNNSFCELGKINGAACCDKSCPECGDCLPVSTLNDFINTICCVDLIINTTDLCNYSLPPCVLFNNGTHVQPETFWEVWVIIIMAGGGGAFTLLIFVCIFYPPERYPPLDYKYIQSKVN